MVAGSSIDPTEVGAVDIDETDIGTDGEATDLDAADDMVMKRQAT